MVQNFTGAIKLCAIVICVISIQVPIAHSASSDWQDLGGGKARLLVHLDPKNDTISGVVEIRLEEGWSTYWRYPGSTGIPPQFDFSKSKAFQIEEVNFPAPQLLTHQHGTYAGYKKKVMFPFDGKLLATSGSEIHMDMVIGICSVVCIPAKAEFNIKSDKLFQSDPESVKAISFARFAIPKKKNASDVLISREQVNEDSLHIKVKHKKSFGKPTLFVEGPADWYLFPAEFVSQEEDVAFFKLDISRAPEGTHIFKHELVYTLVSGTSGIEIQR